MTQETQEQKTTETTLVGEEEIIETTPVAEDEITEMQ